MPSPPRQTRVAPLVDWSRRHQGAVFLIVLLCSVFGAVTAAHDHDTISLVLSLVCVVCALIFLAALARQRWLNRA